MPPPSLKITLLQGAFFPVPPIRGGAVEKLWYQLGLEFARQGHQVTHISRSVPELPNESHDGGVHHLRVPGYDQPKGGIALKCRDFLYTRRALRVAPAADILVTNTFFAPFMAQAKLGRIYVSVERMPKGQMKFYRRASRLRACSKAVGDAIIKEAPSLKNRVRVIPNPLSFHPDQPALARKHPNEILFVGRIHPAKGVDLLLEAFVQGKTNGIIPSPCRLKLIGPSEVGRGGGGEQWWQNTLKNYDRPDIEWIGPIYDPEVLNSYYRAAAVLAYPTSDEMGEAMPVAPLEAMAWGCVPVVSDLACFRDYLEHGRNGFVFNHRAVDGVSALAQTLSLALSPAGLGLSSVASQVRETHACPVIAGKFLEDFQSILASKSSQ